MVVPRGNAPRSSGYQPDALLLSYPNCLMQQLRPTGPDLHERESQFGWRFRLGLRSLRMETSEEGTQAVCIFGF